VEIEDRESTLQGFDVGRQVPVLYASGEDLSGIKMRRPLLQPVEGDGAEPARCPDSLTMVTETSLNNILSTPLPFTQW
jgi:hypothetical protein